MKVFRELRIVGSPQQLEALIQQIQPANGWTRDIEGEQELKRGMWDGYCFRCTKTDERSAATVFLAKGESDLHLANIVPNEHDLSRDEYNSILEDFHHTIVRPANRTLQLKIDMTADHRDITDWITPATERLLRAFSSLANKASLHPYDESRWMDFIIAAHQEDSRLDSNILQRWLEEEESWGAESASRLASRYDFARDLLRKYDGGR